jgi:hypothetical protein
MHLEGFSCVYDQAAQQPEQAPQPVVPAEWQSFATAVAWGDSENGARFIGVEKQFDEYGAREAVLKKCEAQGWRNCVVATSITNGVIVVARDSQRSLRTRVDSTEIEARDAMLAKCETDGVSCKILAVFDGTPEYF